MEISLLPLGHHHCRLSSLSHSDLAYFTRASLSPPSLFLSQQAFFFCPPAVKPRFSDRKPSSALRCICSKDAHFIESHGRRALLGLVFAAVQPLDSTCAMQLKQFPPVGEHLGEQKVPESDFTTLPNGLKYYDLKVGGGLKAGKGSRVAVHYVAKWRGVTFMTSRQGLGVTGGTPYGFDVGQSENGTVLKGLDLGVEGMRVGGQRLLIVPPELAYGSKGVQEIPSNATIELDVELLSIKSNPYGSSVKLVEG